MQCDGDPANFGNLQKLQKIYKKLPNTERLCYYRQAHECLAQLGEHFLDVEGVMGSSPLALTLMDL